MRISYDLWRVLQKGNVFFSSLPFSGTSDTAVPVAHGNQSPWDQRFPKISQSPDGQGLAFIKNIFFFSFHLQCRFLNCGQIYITFTIPLLTILTRPPVQNLQERNTFCQNHFQVYSLMVLSIFTVLCSHHLYMVLDFSSPQAEPCTHGQSVPTSPSSQPAFCLQGFTYFGYFIYKYILSVEFLLWLSGLKNPTQYP